MYKQCKTEQSAKRQRQFEAGLLQLMVTKRYEDITVSDLCDHLQIPRKSFYRYFSSKDGALYALLDHTMMDYEGFNAVYGKNERRTVQKELQQFFEFWMVHKNLLDALAKNKMSGNLVERAMSHITAGNLILGRFLPEYSHYERTQITLFCISGLMSIVLTWHQDGFPHSPEHMAALTARLFSEPLFPNLRDLI